MTASQPPTEFLFSYGTLQLEAVQLATFGRRLVGTSDALPGFEQSMFEIEDKDVVATSGKTLKLDFSKISRNASRLRNRGSGWPSACPAP